jgi:predicted esterase
MRIRSVALVFACSLLDCRSKESASSPAERAERAEPASAEQALPHPPRPPVSGATPLPGSVALANPAWPPPLAAVRTDWCIERVSVLDEETCFALPETKTSRLMVYLHGIVPPEPTSFVKTNFQTVAANAARRAGIALLMPRGERGLGPKGHERWWAWPTTESAYRKYAGELVQRLWDKRKKLEGALSFPFSRVYLAGSSSGAYFVSLLALHGGFPADAYVAVSGGAPVRAASLAGLSPRAFYVGYGTHDSAASGARALASQLTRSGWPVRLAAHPVGHGAHEIYLDEAFAFFDENER